ncbi:hypothetical protein Hanom_Chr14g01314001 [Helianthus anomalus]
MTISDMMSVLFFAILIRLTVWCLLQLILKTTFCGVVFVRVDFGNDVLWCGEWEVASGGRWW